MKPFNLDEYLKKPSRKVVTRNGRNVRIICTDKKGTAFPIVALVECEDKEETCYYPPNGYWNLYEEESDIDLFFVTEKHEGWVNVYNGGADYRYTGEVFSSKERALMVAEGYDCIATIKIEWEE